MPYYTHIALGCSHTRAVYIPQPQRWPHIVEKRSGPNFEYRYMSKIGSGLVHLEKRCHSIPLDKIECVIIQKPQPIRFPWWMDNWQETINQSSYGTADLVKGRKYSMRQFARLSNKKQKRVAEHIFNEELQCLVRIRKLFPKAQIAYYHYWGDNLIDQLHRPNIAYVNSKLGLSLQDLDIDNWGTIVDPHDIPGVYDGEDIIMDMNIIFQNGWITSPTDPHPGLKFHELVAVKVLEWLSH